MGTQNKKKIKILCVDDFGVKYFSKDDADNLLNSLKNHYAVLIYWEGSNYPVLTIYWYYKSGYVDLLMPDYVTKALECLQNPNPIFVQYPITAKDSRWHQLLMKVICLKRKTPSE